MPDPFERPPSLPAPSYPARPLPPPDAVPLPPPTPAAPPAPVPPTFPRAEARDGDTAAVPESPTEPQLPQRASVAANAMALLSSQLVTWMLGTAVTLMIPRFIPPEDQGGLRLAVALWNFPLVVGTFGTSMFLILAIARNRTDGLRLVGSVLAVRWSAFAISSVGLAVFVAATRPDRQFVFLILIVGLHSLLLLTSEGLGSAMIGLERIGPKAVADVAARLVSTIGIIAALLLSGGVRAVVTMTAISGAVNVALLVRSYRRFDRILFRGWTRQVRFVLRGSAGFFVSALVLTLYQQIDTVVLSLLVEDRALGWYATADGFFGSLLFLPTVLDSSLFPVLGRLHATDQAALRTLVQKAFTILFAAAVPIGFGTAIVGPQFAPLVYGEQYREVGQVLVALGPVIAMVYVTTFIGSVALATDRRGFMNTLVAVAALCTIPLDLVLVPWADARWDNGAIGGAVAYIFTEGGILIVAMVVVTPYLLRPAPLWRNARIVIAGGVMAAATYPLRDVFILVPIAVGAVVFVGALAALRVIDPSERAMLAALLRRGDRVQPGDVVAPVLGDQLAERPTTKEGR